MRLGYASPVTFATTKLSYPIFDAEFDPYDRGYLVVAGGGGENRTGVPNKISLLDVSSHDAVTEVTDISLSTDEDSPQSLASLTTKQGLISLVGLSSSMADQKAGKNDHLRSFDVEFPPRKKSKTVPSSSTPLGNEKAARIGVAGKSALFKPPTAKNAKTYQRLLRLSPITSRDVVSKRIGALATADAATNEIVLFDATTFLPNQSSVLQRIELDTEAEDLDLFEYSEGLFGLAFCTNYDVFLYDLKCNFSTKTRAPTTPKPLGIHSVPRSGNGARPKIRCIRWLSKNHLAVLQNRQPGGTPEIVVLQVDADHQTSKVMQLKKLPKSMGIGIRLAVCKLDADPGSGERQIIVAIAGQDKSVHVLTLNHCPLEAASSKQVTPLKDFTVLDTSSQHPQSISKIAFSNFFPPRQPSGSNMSVASDTQYVQLASVSVGYTVSVETFALTSTPTSPALTSKDPIAKRQASSRPSVRWVLSSGHSEFLKSWAGVYVAALVILLLAILTQITFANDHSTAVSLRNLFSNVDPSAGSIRVSSATSSIASAASSLTSTAQVVASSAAAKTEHKLLDLLHIHKKHLIGANPSKAILMSAPENPFAKTELAAELHHSVEEARKQGAKKFDELTEREQKRWLKRLSDAGHWSEAQGVTILKSVLFSEYAGLVGGALRDAVLN